MILKVFYALLTLIDPLYIVPSTFLGEICEFHS